MSSPQTPTRSTPTTLFGAWLALTLSGAASLTLETLWFEWLALHWGRTTEASAAVLAVFMLGLGLGQWLMLRQKQLPLSAAKLWACCEALVGLLALATNWRFAQTSDVVGNNAIIWMLLPTLFMGMTLPLAVSCIKQNSLSRQLGTAYAANTAGAAFGSLATAWWFIPQLGLSGTGIVAVLGQSLAALLVLFTIKTPRSAKPESTAPNTQKPRPWAALAAVAASGFFVLGMEILWFRTLLLTHRSTTENFALMLATVLFGLTIGSAASAYFSKKMAASRYSTNQLLTALLLLQSLATLVTFSLWQPGSALPLLLQCLWLIAPACICSGALMVLAANAFGRRPVRQASSQLILASTLGSAIGAPLIALYWLPHFGVANALQLLLLVAAAAAIANSPRWAFAGLITVAVLATALPSLWQSKQQRAAQLYMQLDDATLLHQADGKYQSVQLLQSEFLGEPLSHRLLTDAYSMTSTAVDSERYMRLFAWLPQAMHSGIHDALLISYGVGTTAETLLANPALQTLTIADPSQAILDTSRLIPRAAQPLDDPRVNLQKTDGRKLLQTASEQFDLITGEPPPPRLAGMHALYSQEYFQLMHGALKPQGLASYWLPVDQLTVASSKAIMQAFCAAFADCSLWAGSHYNWILLGSKARQAQPQAIHTLWNNHSETLKDSGLEDPAQLASAFIADRRMLQQWAGTQAALSDNWPQRIESRWPADSDIRTYAEWMDDRDAERRFQDSDFAQLWQSGLQNLPLAWAMQSLLNGQFRPDPEQRLNVLKQLLNLSHWQTPVLWILGTDQQRLRIAEAKAGDVAALHQAVGRLATQDFAAAEQQFKALSARPNNPFPIAKDLAAIAGSQRAQ